MPKPRSSLVAVDATPYYHCVSRCVRRAFLCGIDAYSGQDYEHRRGWLEQRILKLGQLFCIDVCAYAVMSNHYHVVLHINTVEQVSLSSRQVLERWYGLFKGNQLVSRYLQEDDLCDAELAVIEDLAEQWRERLGSISWFMKVLNEGIAREANFEDGCTGKFWEGRFKSQALLDEKALATCLAYVDLNPIRASMASTPEASDYTTAQKRIKEAKSTPVHETTPYQPKTLLPFVGNPRADMPIGLPFKLTDYLVLLDWTGRILRDDKRGAINQELPPILARLDIDPKNWLHCTANFESSFKGFAGSVDKVKQACAGLGYKRLPNTGALLT